MKREDLEKEFWTKEFFKKGLLGFTWNENIYKKNDKCLTHGINICYRKINEDKDGSFMRSMVIEYQDHYLNQGFRIEEKFDMGKMETNEVGLFIEYLLSKFYEMKGKLNGNTNCEKIVSECESNNC